jgi:pilus assembly protein CpaB
MKRRIAVIVLAVVLAAAGTGAVYAYVHKADQRALAGAKASRVVIVDRRIPAGTAWSDVLSGNYVHQDKVPSDTVPQDAITTLSGSVGDKQVAGSDIAAGQIVVSQMFGAKTSVTGALAIPDDKIAVSVSVPSNADVAGFVQPQSEVAIFATYKVAPLKKDTKSGSANSADSVPPGTLGSADGGSVDVYATKMLLPRVTVLATSQAAPSKVEGASNASGLGGGSSTSNVLVTLALSQADAERLILSQQVGQLYLALLSANSTTSTDPGVINAAKFSPAPIFVQ